MPPKSFAPRDQGARFANPDVGCGAGWVVLGSCVGSSPPAGTPPATGPPPVVVFDALKNSLGLNRKLSTATISVI